MDNTFENVYQQLTESVANLNTKADAHKMGAEAHNVGIQRKPSKDLDFRRLSKGLKGKELKYLEDSWLKGWDTVKGEVS